MICFQKVLWQYLQQQTKQTTHKQHRCDLLSKSSLTIFTTTMELNRICRSPLWFAFKKFFDNIYNNDFVRSQTLESVVICFQKVLWQYLQQLSVYRGIHADCCDLLSKSSLTIFTTTFNFINNRFFSCDLLSKSSLTIFTTTW